MVEPKQLRPDTQAQAQDVVDLFHFGCSNATLEQGADAISNAIAWETPQTVLFLNAAKVADREVDYRTMLAGADHLFADGQSIVFASHLLRRPLPERVAGVDLMDELLSRGSAAGWKVFFLGSTDEVLADTSRLVGERYPGVQIAGTRNGYFDAAIDSAVAAEIKAASPDLLFVAMPSPRKEEWVLQYGPSTGASASMGIGGSLEVLTGRVDRAPEFFQRVGLEWAWRVGQEPGRLWRRYATSNFRFLSMVVGELVRSLRQR